MWLATVSVQQRMGNTYAAAREYLGGQRFAELVRHSSSPSSDVSGLAGQVEVSVSASGRPFVPIAARPWTGHGCAGFYLSNSAAGC